MPRPLPDCAHRFLVGTTLALLLILAGCAGSTSTAPYGGSLNHLHGILALSGLPQTVLVASHVGLYRSADAGAHWTSVAGLSGQPMEGLMISQVIQSAADPQTLYVLAILRSDGPQVAHPQPGMYTSHDGGRTWALATALTAFPLTGIYALGAGSASAGDVYAISRANDGLLHTSDGGHTWAAISTIPFPQGVIGVGRHSALAWSITTGVYRTDDDGATWSALPGVIDGVYAVALAGQTVYATGNDGIFASTDGGAHFTLVAPEQRFTAIAASAADPQRAYGLTGTEVQMTTDGGHTWHATTATTHHLGNLTLDPATPRTVYAGYSYPIGLDRTTDAGTTWARVLP